MRAIWSVVCVAVVLVVPGLPAFAGIDEPAEPELPIGTGHGFEALLPEETVIFASVRDVPALIEKLKALPLGEVVLRDGFFKELIPPMAFDEVRGGYERFIKPLGAILCGEAAFEWAVPDFETATGFAVLADVSAKEEALESYLKDTIYPSMDAAIDREDITIGDDAFVRVPSGRADGATGVFGVTDGIFVLVPPCDSPEAIVEALGERPGASLAVNPDFARVERALSSCDVIGYVNFGAIDRHWKARLAEAGRLDRYNETWGVAHLISGFRQFEGAGVGISFERGDARTTVCCFGSGLDGGIAGALTRAAPLKSLRYVGSDACIYAGVSLGSLSQTCSDLTVAVTKYCELMAGDADEIWWFPAVQGMLGTAQDILPAFGGEVAAAAWIPGGLDVPPAALMVEVKDKEAAVDAVEDMLHGILDAGGGRLTMDEARYEGVEIISLDGVPQVIPAVAIVGDFLVVATNPSVIEDMIDTLTEGPHLGEADGYKRYVASIPGDAAITVYIDVKRIFEFGWPIVAEMTGARRRAEGTFKAIGELGQAFSPLGIKVLGSENGATLVSRSANGGLAVVPLFAGFAVVPIRVGVDVGGLGPVDEEFDPREEFEPEIVDHDEVEEAEEEIEPENE